MGRYQLRGTPSLVVIDRAGRPDTQPYPSAVTSPRLGHQRLLTLRFNPKAEHFTDAPSTGRFMYTYSELETIAGTGGYTIGARDISRITVAHVHQVYAGLVNSGSDEANAAVLALSKLRLWLVHGGTEPPPVRGAGFLRTDREVWIAYTTHESPALVRGRESVLADLGRYLPVAASPHYDGSLRLRTSPPIQLVADGGVVLRSPLGSVMLSRQAALDVEQWLAVTIRRKDRRGVLCLPGAWHSD